MNPSTLLSHSLAALGMTVLAAGAQTRPVTNPVYFDDADVGTSIHPIFMQHKLPGTLNTELGDIPVGGDVQVYALQFEIKLAENLSLIAVKDGYVDAHPDATLSKASGIADLAAGLKYVFLRNDDTVASVRATYEIPIGDDEVWQGQGDGTFNPGITIRKEMGSLQCTSTAGGIIGVNDKDSTLGYASAHLSMPVCRFFTPLVEVNYFRVLDAGDGGGRFKKHADGGVPAVARWEGGDLINLGASHADDNPDFATLGLGFRIPLSVTMDLGAAYEMPLTDEKNSLMDSRITVDAVIRF